MTTERTVVPLTEWGVLRLDGTASWFVDEARAERAFATDEKASSLVRKDIHITVLDQKS